MTINELTYNSFDLVTPKVFRIMVMGCLIFVFICLLVAYGIIFKTAKRHARQIAAIDNIAKSLNPGRTKTISKTDIKIARMMFMVFGLFYLTYAPAVFTYVLTRTTTGLMKNTTLRFILMVTNRLIPINSIINPITYAFKDVKFRSSFKMLFNIKASDNNNFSHTSTT